MNFNKLKKGSQGKEVGLLHKILLALAIKVEAEEVQKLFFGNSTEEALKEFQGKYKLRPTGKINILTAQILERVYKFLFDKDNNFAKFKINGRVIDEEKNPVKGATVELWALLENNKDVSFKKTAKTRRNGKYSISITFKEIINIIKEGVPKIFFKVYLEETLIEDTRDSVVWNPDVGQLELEIVVSELPTFEEWIIEGTITNQGKIPIKNLLVRAFNQVPNTPNNPLGQSAITDAEGNYSISFTEADFKVPKESGGPDVFIQVYAGEEVLGESPVKRNARKTTNINLQVEIRTETYILAGGVYTSKRVGAPDVKVQVLDKRVEGDKLLGMLVTDRSGQFSLEFDFPIISKDKPDLQVVAIDAKDPKKVLGRSEVRYDASPEENLDLILPAANDPVLPDEFQELKANLSKHARRVPFKDLQENEEKSDISLLAGKTGIDARLIGMTALAHEFGEKNDLPADVYYALFRAGQPTDEAGISRIHSGTVKNVLEQAVKQNVIAKEYEARIPEYVQKFEDTAVAFTLQHKGSVGLSTMDEFLGLTFDNAVEKIAFAKLYRENQDKPDQLWEKATAQFGEERTKRLQLDGKLGFMTLNNGQLVQKLRVTQQITQDPVELVRNGFYKAEKWQEVLSGDIPIPASISGEDNNTKKQNYANMMTAQLRLSYPTAVLAKQVEGDEFVLTGDAQAKQGITTFLNNHQGGFEIGKTPVIKYIKDNNLQLEPEVLKGLKRAERVYQISPSDQVMKVLLQNNLDSAFAIANKYSEDYFVQRYSADMGGENMARMTYSKSTMVAGAVMNVALAYGSHRRNPSIYSINAGHHLHKDAPGADDVIINPTLEELFGEMDYCECEHCRSVLSPAAYFVDLLKFIDRTENLGGKENPYEVLRSRRPDLEYIALTCENTNTVLPYIDLVNEILEYFVVNGNLNGFQGYNVEEDEESADLLANPNFVLDQAYQTLQGEVYPMKLPFNYFLETSRAYFDHMKVPLWVAMKRLRSGDTMTSPADPTDHNNPLAPYGWKEIYTEFLGITPQLHSILTSNTNDLAEYYGENAGTDLNAFLSTDNEYSKKLTRKLGISYKEIVNIVKTRFFNPNAHLIEKLEKLEVGLPTIIDYINSNGVNDFQLPPDLDQNKYDGDAKAWLLRQDPARNIDNPAHIRSLIFLTDPAGNTDDCNFVPLHLRYADGSVLRPIEYWKLLRFVRLWKSLGWTIEQTDFALASLYDQAQIPQAGDADDDAITKLNQGFDTFLIRLAQALEIMDLLRMNVKRGLGKAMALWSEINTYGRASLYRQLFLNPTIRKIDSVFEPDSYGQYLQDDTQTLSGHVPAILAVLNLKEDAYQLLVSALGLPDKLTLENLSHLFRYATLSRALRISIHELLTIRNLTGIEDLFGGLGTVPNPTLRFIEIVRRVKDAGFKIPNLNYLLTHEDLSGKASPSLRDILSFAKSVRTELLAIEQDNQESLEDPDGELARAKLSQTFGEDVANQFFGLIERSATFSTVYDHNAEDLEVGAMAVNSRLQYDDANKLLSFDGVMGEEEKSTYIAIVGTTQPFKDAISLLHAAQGPFETTYDHGGAALSTEILGVSSHLMYDDFAKQLSFQGVMNQSDQASLKSLGLPVAFNEAIDRLFIQSQTLFDQLPELGNLYQAHFEGKNIVSRRASYSQILPWILPIVKPRLKQIALRELVGSSLRSDSELLGLLLESPEVIHSEGDQTKPLIEDFYAAEPNAGFTADSPVAGQLRLRSFIDPIATDFFNLYIETDAVNVSVQIDEEIMAGTLANGVWVNDATMSLKAGELLLLEIILEGTANQPTVKWATRTMGKVEIPVEHLFSFDRIETFKGAYLRLLKSTALVEALSFTPEEVLHFSQFTIDVAGAPTTFNWLNAIQCPNQSTPANIQQVFDHFLTLLIYGYLKEHLDVEEDDLIAILENPQALNENGENLLLKITGWQVEDRDRLLARFGWALADLSDPIRLKHLSEAFDMLTQTGLSASLLSSIANVSPTLAHLTELQAGLRIKYEITSWREIIQPINDRLRTKQRDALVSYVLYQLSRNQATEHLNTSEKLFEYLLIDVEMDSCMKTSRIKQAISTVQLFIHRCFLNLEKNVSPGALNTKQWDWMKRYRVWEANRKVFLWPENWLEPELRDNKSSFFKELEGELLQSDITEESAATALLNYLEKLDTVSKLEICGMYVQENQIKKDGAYYSADDIVHVIGMTPGANRKYYYRRFEYGYWTPWEKVDLDIEDTPVLPVVWKDRLFLFWLNLMPEGEKNTKSTIKKGRDNDLINAKLETPQAEPQVKTMASMSWSEYMNGKWQPRRTTDYKVPFEFYIGSLDRKITYMSTSEGKDGELIVSAWNRQTFSFFNKNSIPEKGYTADLLNGEFRNRLLVNDSGPFGITYSRSLYNNGVGYSSIDGAFYHDILLGKKLKEFESIQPLGAYKGNYWEKPFFLQNSRHVFYVSPKESYYTIPIYDLYGVFVTPPFVVAVPGIPEVWIEPTIPLPVDPIDPIFRIPPVDIGRPILEEREMSLTDRLGRARVGQAVLNEQTFYFRGVSLGTQGVLSNTVPDLQFQIPGSAFIR